jgi:hypothetical protein
MASLQRILIAVFCFLFLTATAHAQASAPAENVIVVTLDGMRWQEVFGGADKDLISKVGGDSSLNAADLGRMYLRDTPAEQRAVLMPFLWNVVAKEGQIFGDRTSNSVAVVTNPQRISYPGYSELMTGLVEPKINSNYPLPNPNPTVFEWLNKQPDFAGKVAVFGAWERVWEIINPKRSGVYVMGGWHPIAPLPGETLSDRQQLLNEMLQRQTRLWPTEPPDVYCQSAAIEFFKRRHPRVMWVMLGETDAWAHRNRYDMYLNSAKHSDAFIRELWETAQSMPSHKGKTALLITTDHGRGTGGQWRDHGSNVKGCEGIWIAVMGPGTPAEGIRKDVKVTQSQVAATIAGLLGQDYHAAVPQSAAALPGVGVE